MKLSRYIRLKWIAVSALPVILFPGGSADAQVYGTAAHSVTVQVSVITAVKVTGGSVNLNISSANVVAGQDQMSVVDQSTSLLWGTNSSARKISVGTSLAAPKFTLKLLAVNPTQGTAAPAVTLTAAPHDLLLNIGRSSGSCTLQYTGIALASQGTGNDVHVITFTVQTQ
ncbi:MAG TPA: hypothetical protein VK569_02710 [Bacteroidota bacterium]|nr:hypothetical protein [Bacteroidota bacterium]